MLSKKALLERIDEIQKYTFGLEERINYLESLIDLDSFESYNTQYNKNKETANKEGLFYLSSKTDTQLLEKVISEINKNEDLTALFRTADGATLSLRVHPQPKMSTVSSLSKFDEAE